MELIIDGKKTEFEESIQKAYLETWAVSRDKAAIARAFSCAKSAAKSNELISQQKN